MPQARRSRLSLTRWDDCATFPLGRLFRRPFCCTCLSLPIYCKSLHLIGLTFYLQASEIDALWDLQKQYKAEIGEDEPSDDGKERLADAIDKGKITFYGVWKDNTLIGCCSITVVFSTFDYHSSGVFEDFYICPEYRHQGIARRLVEFAYHESGVSSLTVGCADCDVKMYQSLGFAISLGNLLAFE